MSVDRLWAGLPHPQHTHVRLLTHSLTYSIIHSHLCTHSLSHLLTHSLPHSFTDTVTQSLTHSLNHTYMRAHSPSHNSIHAQLHIHTPLCFERGLASQATTMGLQHTPHPKHACIIAVHHTTTTDAPLCCRVRFLYNNDLSGTIPASLGSMDGLIELYVQLWHTMHKMEGLGAGTPMT